MWNLTHEGQLNYNTVYLPPNITYHAPQQQQYQTIKNTTDIHSVYANSIEALEDGHLAVFTGIPSIIKNNEILESFNHSSSNAHSMPSIKAHSDENVLAGIVLSTVAGPSDTEYLHENSFSSRHSITGHNHIVRLARPGSVCLAWVIDDHENTWNGIYEKTINGGVTGTAVIRDIDDEHFSIDLIAENTSNLQEQIDALREKLETLTSN